MLRLLLLIVLVEGATQAHANEETAHAKQKEEIVGRAHHSLRKLRRHGHHDAQQQLTAASVYAVGYSVSADVYVLTYTRTMLFAGTKVQGLCCGFKFGDR